MIHGAISKQWLLISHSIACVVFFCLLVYFHSNNIWFTVHEEMVKNPYMLAPSHTMRCNIIEHVQ